MFQLNPSQELGKELRQVVVDTLKELMDQDERIIALDADLGAASGFNAFNAAHGDQFINVGIAEANMVGVAAGLSLTGYIPYIHTFGPFATRRVFDQLFISGGYAAKRLNVFGSDPGFAVGHNGGTHTTWEDVALMRAIPHATVCDAADATQMAWIIREFKDRPGINYVRGNRKAVRKIYEEGSTFEIGKGNQLQAGSEILLIGTGQLVSETLDVAKRLDEEGVSAAVIDMFTIKPIDEALLVSEIADKRLVVTIENHSITGGLGSAVAEVMATYGFQQPLVRIGVDERYGQVGLPDFLQEEYGLTATKIYEQIQPHL